MYDLTKNEVKILKSMKIDVGKVIYSIPEVSQWSGISRKNIAPVLKKLVNKNLIIENFGTIKYYELSELGALYTKDIDVPKERVFLREYIKILISQNAFTVEELFNV